VRCVPLLLGCLPPRVPWELQAQHPQTRPRTAAWRQRLFYHPCQLAQPAVLTLPVHDLSRGRVRIEPGRGFWRRARARGAGLRAQVRCHVHLRQRYVFCLGALAGQRSQERLPLVTHLPECSLGLPKQLEAGKHSLSCHKAPVYTAAVYRDCSRSLFCSPGVWAAGGAPGLGPLALRREPAVFKETFRSRGYCLSECTHLCAQSVGGGPGAR
jgi:hypothetical protein